MPPSLGEALANQGLQQSNLSNFAAAERLLSRAPSRASPQGDGVLQRLIRNYRAINQLNQRNSRGGARRSSPSRGRRRRNRRADQDARDGLITLPLADESTARTARHHAGQRASATSLRPAERAAILDAQALSWPASRFASRDGSPKRAELLGEAARQAERVRDGKLLSAAG